MQENNSWSKERQADFIRDLTTAIANRMLADIDAGRVPANWQGLELRAWVDDVTALYSGFETLHCDRDRHNAYIRDRASGNMS